MVHARTGTPPPDRPRTRGSQSIPVTSTFERAGEVTIDAMVAARGQDATPTDDFPDPAEDPTDDSTQ